MSLPNYLAKIKSAGLYRFTFDNSQLPAADAETMRLVIGYSDKGPFNNPVYIDNKQDFITLFGNINKKLEKKGVFFHRMALQALSAGPILALNLKPFSQAGESGTQEQIDLINFNPCDLTTNSFEIKQMNVLDLFDRNRFWKVEADQLPDKITHASPPKITNKKYITIAATDALERSCSIFFRKCHDNSVKQYNVSVRDWYKQIGENIPEYLEGYEDTNIKDYFAEIYVFRGEFTKYLTEGALSKYFDTIEDKCALKTDYTDTFGDSADALAALSDDYNSNFIGVYRGCLLPYFKDQLGLYVSLDIVFNSDKDTHKMIMKLDDSVLESLFDADIDITDNETGDDTTGDDTEMPAQYTRTRSGSCKHTFGGEYAKNGLNHWPTTGWNPTGTNADINIALQPTYIRGYSYGTINKNSTSYEIYVKSLKMLADKGIFTALTNHVDSEYHYIVDTFATLIPIKGTQLSGPIGIMDKVATSKHYIAAVAKAKDNCLAILNAPATNDMFKNIENFNMSAFEKREYQDFFALPSEVDGASYCAYYTPLVFGEDVIKTVVPSAALVSNNYMEKWKSRQPYYIVAGPNHGRMEFNNLIGPDYNYSRADLDIFEPMGINCMVYVPRKGTYINSNQTAKQTPVSALSKVHVRELVIYLQDEIEKMMQNYQWELNTQTLRDTIKTKADAILEKIKANGGVYEYVNVCDGSNNTAEVIDNEMIILDTSIEPARGAGKMVQRLTIHKTGAISALTK